MKKFSLLGALVGSLVLFVLSACAETRIPVIERQELAVTLVPQMHQLIGESKIFFSSSPGRALFRLNPAAAIDSITVDTKPFSYLFNNGMLALEIPPASPAAPVALTVKYRVRFNDVVPDRPASSEDPTYGIAAVISERGTFLGSESEWFPVPATTPARRLVRVETPPGTEAITSGKRVLRQTSGAVWRSVWEEARPVGELSLSAGGYRIEERRMNGIDLYTYFYPDNAELSGRYLDAAEKYIKFYTDLFGPYPFEKFAVVENFFPTGYGLPSYTLLGSSIIRLPFIIYTSFPHEIAHSWWGNGIEVDLSQGNWSEGLVTYLADYLLKEKRSPQDARDYRRQLLADYASLVTPERDFPLTSFTSRVDPASRAIGYGKAAMVFHMVRTRVGDKAFFDALREVCRKRMYQSATWGDFVRAFSHTSGQDMAPFLNQWLTRTGGPRLAFSGVTRQHEGEGCIVTGNVLQTPPLYDVEVPIEAETSGAPVRQVLRLDEERTPFRIAASDLPRRLFLDPDAEVFRVLSHEEIPLSVNRIKGSRNLVGVTTQNCQAKPETFRLLLESLDQASARVVNEEQLDPATANGSDLLFCGIPRDNTLLPPLPEGIHLSDREFSVNSEPFRTPDGLLFLVLRHPMASGRIIGLFLPLSDSAAERYALKITHYGSYGYLTFTSGAIRSKGTFPPSAGPSLVTF